MPRSRSKHPLRRRVLRRRRPRLGYDAGAARPSKVRPDPLRAHAQPILGLRQRHDMDEGPDEPGDEAAYPNPASLQHGEILADNGHIAFVEIPELIRRTLALELACNPLADESALLDRRLRDSGHWPGGLRKRRRIADHEDLGRAWNVHKRIDQDPAGTICLDAEQFGDRGR